MPCTVQLQKKGITGARTTLTSFFLSFFRLSSLDICLPTPPLPSCVAHISSILEVLSRTNQLLALPFHIRLRLPHLLRQTLRYPAKPNAMQVLACKHVREHACMV